MMSEGERTVLPDTSDDRVSYRTLLIGLVLAIVAATVANIVVYYIADGAGTMPKSVKTETFTGDEASIGIGAVITTTISFWVAGAIALLLLRAFTRRPMRIFWIVAVVAFFASLAMPFSIDDAPGDMIVTLLLMHLLAFAVGGYVLNQVVRSENE
jgi:hypothetical protein